SARLLLVGASPAPQVTALASLPGVEVTGTVPDVRPYLWSAAVSAAPLHTARGTQNKVLEAIAAGLPVVITPVVAQGLTADVLRACAVASDPRGFAHELVHLLERPSAERRAIAASANLAALGWDRCLQPLVDLLIEAAHRGAPSPAIPSTD
ncbi:MAG TPA: glycosyltransferase, partial [Vicinamibacterales bacterium]